MHNRHKAASMAAGHVRRSFVVANSVATLQVPPPHLKLDDRSAVAPELDIAVTM